MAISNDDQPAARFATRQDGVDLIELTRILWSRRLLVTLWALASAALFFAVTFLFPRSYRAEVVVMAKVADPLASSLGGLQGLAGLAGVRLPTQNNESEYVALLRSRSFAASFINEFGLVPVLLDGRLERIKSKYEDSVDGSNALTLAAVDQFHEDVLVVEEDPLAGLITVSVYWTDPSKAAEWANALVRRLNAFIRERDLKDAETNLIYLREALEKTTLLSAQAAVSRLIESEVNKAMVAKGNEDYAFRVIDPAVSPLNPSSPKRLLATIGGLMLGAFLGAGYAILRLRQ